MPERSTALALLASSFAATLLLFPGLFLGAVPLFRDFMILVLPLRSAAAEAIRAGELPLWTPHLFFGAPFLANYQSAVLYPPSWLFSLLPPATALTPFLAFHLVVAAVGMTRYLSRQLELDRLAAVFGGLVFAFGGFFASLLPMTNQLEAAAWLPWILDTAEDVGRGRPELARHALLVALQTLGGAAEVVILTQVAVVAVLCRRGRPDVRALFAIGAAGALGLGIAALQLLPTAEYAMRSDRAAVLPLSGVITESLRWKSLQQLLVPNAFVDGAPGFTPEGGVPLLWSIYLGIAPLAFALAAVIDPRSRVWLALAAISVAFALGDQTPVLPALYGILPSVVGAFRFPIKFFLLAHTALAVLAAIGLSLWTAGDARGRLVPIAVACALVAGLVGASAALAPESTLRLLGYDLRQGLAEAVYAEIGSQVGGRALRSAVVAGALLLGAAFALRRGTPAWLAIAVAGLFVVDVAPIHRPLLGFVEQASLGAENPARAAGIAPEERVFHYCTTGFGCLPAGAHGLGIWSGSLRVLQPVEERAKELWRAVIPNLPIAFANGAVGGNDGLLTGDQRALATALAMLPRDRGTALLGALGVSQLIGPEPIPGLASTTLSKSPALFRSAPPNVAPRTYLAERSFGAPSVEEALARIASPEFVAGRDVALVGSSARENVTFGKAEIVAFEAARHRLVAILRLDADGLWVVGDTWFPGWRATVDEQPVELLRANGFQRAVRVPAGEHRVEMVYRSRAFEWGAWLSLASVAIVGGVAWRERRRART